MPTPVFSDSSVLRCRDGRLIELVESAYADRTIFDARYRNVERTLSACRQCPGYGRSWSCPPLEVAITAPYSCYGMVKLYVAKIPAGPGIPVREAATLLWPVKEAILTYMREREHQQGGRICGLAGICELCASEGCTRPGGAPCRYPDKVRPSLEALGYDVAEAVKGMTGLAMLWGNDGYLPEYLLLVGAHFANQ